MSAAVSKGYFGSACRAWAIRRPSAAAERIRPEGEGNDMSKTKELPACPVETTLMLISDRWKVLILRDLMEGTRRFGELKKSIGSISQKVLTANLRDMEADGLLTRKVYPEVPPRVEYTLTETGYSLRSVLDAMTRWGTEYQQKTV